MTPERWDRICAVFNTAVEQPPAERKEFLRRSCEGDPELYAEVSRMLRSHDATGPLDHPPAAAAAPALAGHAPVFQAGQLVSGRYSIMRYLSRGGMGEVYEARDLDLGEALHETIALKTLLPGIAEDESMVAHFKREIALSRKVAHPNVCKVYHFDSHEPSGSRPVRFFTMEYLEGETLESRLRGGAMPESEALPLLRQMAEALDASHAAGVIHRDFKPGNVMLISGPERVLVKVTDFGLARRFVASGDPTATLSKVLMGTLDYMAPELLTGSSASFSSDIYALGMTAWRTMAGSLPFEFEADTAMARAILRCRRPLTSPRERAPGLSVNAERAILKALAADPGERFSSARLFIEALEGSLPVAAPKKRWVPAAIAAGAILLAAGAYFGVEQWRRAGLTLPPEAQTLYQKGAEDNAAGAYFAATKALEEAAKVAPRAPQIHAQLAEAWVALDMPEKGAEQMLLVRREDTSGLERAERLKIEAIDLSLTQEYLAAAGKYDEASRIRPEDAELAVAQGRAYESADRPADAMKNYRRAAEGPRHSPAAWLRLAVLYVRQANKAKAEEAFAQAERLYQLTSNLEGLTEVALQRGIAANAAGRLEQAAVFLNQALVMARNQGNLQEEIGATLRLSQNAYMAGDADAAERYAREALDTARENHFDGLAVRGLINVGNASRRKQDSAAAERYYQDALKLADQSHSSHLRALSLFSLAALHDDTHEADAEVREAREALRFYEQNHYAKETVQVLTLLARTQRDQGDFDGALASFRDLLRRAEASGDRAQISLAHEVGGGRLFEMENYPAALEEYRKSAEFAADPEHSGRANLTVGNTLWRLGDYAGAEAEFARAASAAQSFLDLRLQLIFSRANMALSLGRFRDAADGARAALAQGASRNAGSRAQNEEMLGLALSGLGNHKEGAAECELARTAFRESHYIASTIRSAVSLMQVSIASGDTEAALRLFREIEPQLAQHPEMQWRALALVASIDKQYSGAARDSLQKLSRFWGESAYNTYLKRPDIAKLSAPLLH